MAEADGARAVVELRVGVADRRAEVRGRQRHLDRLLPGEPIGFVADRRRRVERRPRQRVAGVSEAQHDQQLLAGRGRVRRAERDALPGCGLADEAGHREAARRERSRVRGGCCRSVVVHLHIDRDRVRRPAVEAEERPDGVDGPYVVDGDDCALAPGARERCPPSPRRQPFRSDDLREVRVPHGHQLALTCWTTLRRTSCRTTPAPTASPICAALCGSTVPVTCVTMFTCVPIPPLATPGVTLALATAAVESVAPSASVTTAWLSVMPLAMPSTTETPKS